MLRLEDEDGGSLSSVSWRRRKDWGRVGWIEAESDRPRTGDLRPRRTGGGGCSILHVISSRPLREFREKHPDAETPLRAWIKIVERADWKQFSDVRATFRTADQVGKFTVFNIGGNKYRLNVVIHHDRGKVYVRHILTHSEYSRSDWKHD
jgi:mRNA interferase HigB